jgi:hypothetical protein
MTNTSYEEIKRIASQLPPDLRAKIRNFARKNLSSPYSADYQVDPIIKKDFWDRLPYSELIPNQAVSDRLIDYFRGLKPRTISVDDEEIEIWD